MKTIGIVVVADLKSDYIFVDGLLFVSRKFTVELNMVQGKVPEICVQLSIIMVV